MSDEIYTVLDESAYLDLAQAGDLQKAKASLEFVCNGAERLPRSTCFCPSGYVDITTRHDSAERQARWPMDLAERYARAAGRVFVAWRACRKCGESAMLLCELPKVVPLGMPMPAWGKDPETYRVT